MKFIGTKAFYRSGVTEIHIPDSVETLRYAGFSYCSRLSRVTFGKSSSLKVIGKRAFSCTGLREVHIPDGIKELPEDDVRYIRIVRPQ